MSHWNTDRVPLGHPPCTTGTPTVYHWDTDRVPLGHPPCTTGVRTVYHWGTHRVPVGYAPCPSGVRTVSQWGTHRVPVGYAPCPSGVRTVSHGRSTLSGAPQPRSSTLHRPRARRSSNSRRKRETPGGDAFFSASGSVSRHGSAASRSI